MYRIKSHKKKKFHITYLQRYKYIFIFLHLLLLPKILKTYKF